MKWALAGYGFGGRVFHAPLIDSTPDLRLVAVVTGNTVRQREVRELYEGATAVSSLAELAGLGLAGVTISTPSATHAALAHEAMDLGLDVVLDKPFGLTEADAQALADHAQAADRVLVPYQNRRWDSDFRTIQQLLADGVLGQVYRFTSRIDRFRPVRPGTADTHSPAVGGGVLLDLGPHLIDQAVQLWGPVDEVYAELSTFRPGAAAEDDVLISLRHRGGVLSTLAAGKAAAAAGPRFVVNGSAGGYAIDGFDGQEDQLISGVTPDTAGGEWGLEPASAHGNLSRGVGDPVSWPSVRGRWDSFYPAVAQAVRRAGPPPVTVADAIGTMRIIDAARRSSAAREIVTLAN